jgi:hypothetical protein
MAGIITLIRDFEALDDLRRRGLIRTLIPRVCFEQFGINPENFQDEQGVERLRISFRNHGRILAVRITSRGESIDPIYSIFMQDFDEQSVDVIGLNINDPQAERFDVDLDEFGRIPADFFSRRRNVAEEVRAVQAGLAPGQVRKGLRWVGDVLAALESFLRRLGKRWIYCEAMAYHNAMVYEKHGFGYHFRTWMDEMIWIDREFRPPHGSLYKKMDGSTPFRQPGMENTVRGRSWAIHDGIIGSPWSAPAMIKEVGVHAGVNTFPGGVY